VHSSRRHEWLVCGTPNPPIYNAQFILPAAVHRVCGPRSCRAVKVHRIAGAWLEKKGHGIFLICIRLNSPRRVHWSVKTLPLWSAPDALLLPRLLCDCCATVNSGSTARRGFTTVTVQNVPYCCSSVGAWATTLPCGLRDPQGLLMRGGPATCGASTLLSRRSTCLGYRSLANSIFGLRELDLRFPWEEARRTEGRAPWIVNGPNCLHCFFQHFSYTAQWLPNFSFHCRLS
jgi:hypothetical protein